MNKIRWIALIVYMLLPLSVHAMDFGEFLVETMNKAAKKLLELAERNNKPQKWSREFSNSGAADVANQLLFYEKEVARIFKNKISITEKTITAFHLACRYGTLMMVSTFLCAGFPVNAKNSQDFTPLMTSLEAGNYDVVQLLLCRGADFMIKSEHKPLISLPDTTKIHGRFINSKYYSLNLIAMTRYPHINPFDECKETIKSMIINYTRIAQENRLLREV